jgi:hypothetical protein
MSESLERRLSIRERLGLRLHLSVCAWCARYLKQIKFMRWMMKAQNSRATNEVVPLLPIEARERIARAIQNRDR